ncbi:hypothetical protein P692DRAFT_201785484 [Suillus brevipes Sb2]|nr:hypothetical protein P692DRAFT_201785484 [Suillus brevipes Sb2]
MSPCCNALVSTRPGTVDASVHCLIDKNVRLDLRSGRINAAKNGDTVLVFQILPPLYHAMAYTQIDRCR